MLGLLLNRAYKRAITARLNGSLPDAPVPPGGRAQSRLTMALFALMGRIAKLDGRVNPNEVKYASTIMELMDLRGAARAEAISYFEQGKQPNSDVLRCVSDMAKSVAPRSPLAHLFLKIQCRMAYVKGDIRLQEKVLLRDTAELLGFDKEEFLAICTEMQTLADQKQLRAQDFLNNAYKVLQLEPEVEDGEIRRAYLRLMSRYHPDKLVRDNLSESSLKQAQERSTAIRSAYETICGHRKIRV